jgi:hypothetical protein
LALTGTADETCIEAAPLPAAQNPTQKPPRNDRRLLRTSKGSKGGEGEGEGELNPFFGAMSLRRCPRVVLWRNPTQSHRKRLVGHRRRSLVHPLSYLSFIPVQKPSKAPSRSPSTKPSASPFLPQFPFMTFGASGLTEDTQNLVGHDIMWTCVSASCPMVLSVVISGFPKEVK